MYNVLMESLKEHKTNESTIETTLSRVQAYKDAIANPDSFTQLHMGNQVDLGMPRGKGGKPSSPVEMIVEKNEIGKEEAIKTLREWVKEDLSKIYPLQIEVEQVKGALNALTKQQKYIIECKYFEKMFWREIEINFNDKFKAYLTCSQLKKKNKESLCELSKILRIYYERKYGTKFNVLL